MSCSKFGHGGLEAVLARDRKFGVRHSKCVLKWKGMWLLMEGSVERERVIITLEVRWLFDLRYWLLGWSVEVMVFDGGGWGRC